ncbi:MAG: hypothetical protein WCT44_03740 [Candidatus Paceibacterota bacterium]
MKKNLVVLSGLVMSLAPVVASAANFCGSAQSGTLGSIICKIGDLLNAVIPVLVVLGIVYFVWGVITYVISKEEEAKKAGRNRIIFGIIGLVAIVAMWGLVNILIRTFGLEGPATVTLPSVQIN